MSMAIIGWSQQSIVIPDFTLRSTADTMVSLTNYPSAKGFMVIFTCNHCPFAKLYPERMNRLSEKYAPLGVPLLAINSMDSVLYEEESFFKMQRKAKKENFKYPYLQDASQSVGKLFGAEHTPQAFVIWKEDAKWMVKYSGAIDDNGENSDIAKSFVAQAVDDLLSGIPVSQSSTASFGCRIFYRK
jgi:alkyl hydroperoxide reductase subunit AhpC